MDKLWQWIRNHLPERRRLIQLYAALLYNAHLKGFAQGEIYTGSLKNLCVPGLNCYSCPGAVGACPMGALQNALASSENRFPAYMLGMIALLGLTLGRVVCGFLCPVGLMQELIHKLPTPKIPKSRYTRILSGFKYFVLVVFAVLVPLAYAPQSFPVPAFCKYICPAGTLEGAVGLLSNPVNADKFSMLNILFTRKFIILIGIAALSVFMYRFFCRFLCPLGALYSCFSRIALLGVRIDQSRCVDCGQCVTACKMDVRRVGDRECIHCGECVSLCPTKAIVWKGKRVRLQGNAVISEKAHVDTADASTSASGTHTAGVKRSTPFRAIAWSLALVLLCAVLWQVNQPSATASLTKVTGTPSTSTIANGQSNPTEPSGLALQTAVPNQPSATNVPEGKDVGMRAADFTLQLYGGGTFRLSEKQNKPVVLNFWATWCTPCVHELPYFQQLWETYGDRVAIVAIHSDLVTDDVEAYLAQEGYTMPFALDEDGSVIANLGGSTMLPMTVIIDQHGVITYNKVGSVTYALLEEEINRLLPA